MKNVLLNSGFTDFCVEKEIQKLFPWLISNESTFILTLFVVV